MEAPCTLTQPRWGWLIVLTGFTQGSGRSRNPGLDDTAPLGLNRLRRDYGRVAQFRG